MYHVYRHFYIPRLARIRVLLNVISHIPGRLFNEHCVTDASAPGAGRRMCLLRRLARRSVRQTVMGDEVCFSGGKFLEWNRSVTSVPPNGRADVAFLFLPNENLISEDT